MFEYHKKKSIFYEHFIRSIHVNLIVRFIIQVHSFDFMQHSLCIMESWYIFADHQLYGNFIEKSGTILKIKKWKNCKRTFERNDKNRIA